MRILLAYSRRHFDPATAEQSSEKCGMSAAVLARSLWEELSEFGTVDYVDGLKTPSQLPHQEYDLFVGIQGALKPLSKLATFKYKVVFCVNMHPVERNRILQEVGKIYRLCRSRHISRNCVFLSQLDDLNLADSILMVGNSTVLHSFVRWGKPLSQLRCINYASINASAEAKQIVSDDGIIRILYVATEMCLRKGFDIIAELFIKLRNSGTNIQAHVIGGAGDAEYRAKLKQLQEQLGDSICVHGWVDSSSQDYVHLLQKCDFILFPSLEEGQAGSVLDAMSQGLIPIVSRETGIDWSPLGYLEARPASAINESIVLKLRELSTQDIVQLKEDTLSYYRREHENWRTILRRILKGIVHRHSLWPSIHVESSDESVKIELQSIYPSVCENEADADYVLKIPVDTKKSISPSVIFDMVDFLEKHQEISRAIYCGEPLQGIRWTKCSADAALTEEHSWQLVSRLQADQAVCWLMTSAHGEASASIPLSYMPDSVAPFARWKKMLMPLAWLGGKLAPSRQHRKLLYNMWKKSQIKF